MLLRWAIIWLPLFVPLVLATWLFGTDERIAFIFAFAWLLLWIGTAVHGVIHPQRGLHDRLAGTWVVRR